MQVRKTNYQVNATPKFQVLTEDEIEAIYYSALTVLYETGVRVYDKEGVQVNMYYTARHLQHHI